MFFIIIFSVFIILSIFILTYIKLRGTAPNLGAYSFPELPEVLESLGVCSVGEFVGTVGVCGGFCGGVICGGYWKGDCIIITGGC